MIRKIGVLCQDVNSLGFLAGIRSRLGCKAELIQPESAAFAKVRQMKKNDAKLASRYFANKGADLIIRFTDADRHRWQDVKRHEQNAFPDDVKSILICGVAVENVEEWLALDANYLSSELAIPLEELRNSPDRSDKIKRGLSRRQQISEPASEVVSRFVQSLPDSVFSDWLRRDDALRDFFTDCRNAAMQVGCSVPSWS